MKFDEQNLQLFANTIRGLSMDAIEAANSGKLVPSAIRVKPISSSGSPAIRAIFVDP